IILLHVVDGSGDLLAQDIEAAIELLVARDSLAAPDEGLQMQGLCRLDALAEVAVVDGRLAEPEKHLALIGDRLLDHLAAEPRRLLVLREEKMPARRAPGWGKLKAELRALLHEEAMRDLHHDPAAVSELRIGPHRSPVAQVEKDLQALLDDVVTLRIRHVGDDADTAGIMLARGIEQTLRGRASIQPAGGRHGFASAGPRNRALMLACRNLHRVHVDAFP